MHGPLSRQVAAITVASGISLAMQSVPTHLQAQSIDSLTSAVARALASQGLVGATWSLVTPDGVTLGAAGLRDREINRGMTADTRVQVGSVTKTLIAVGVLRLVTLRRVALDAPVSQYLPELPLDNPWERQQPVLVRHLLDHTSGIEDAHLWQVFTMRADPDSPLVSGLVREGGRLRIRSRPGARFSYSNTGFLTLGLLIERVTGMRYETWLDRELLAPLGMTRSTFAFVSQQGANADTSLAMGYFDGITPNPSYAIPVRPATQFATTAQDMATLDRFLMSDGMLQGRQFIDGGLLHSMALPTTTEAVEAGLPSGYALGLARRERWGITGKCHMGSLGTFRAIHCLYPEHQRAFFASYNTDPEDGNFDAIDSLFASSLGVPLTPAVPAARPGIDPSAWNGWYVVRPNRFAQFAYLDEVAGVTRIAWDGTVLQLRPFQGLTRRLQPVGGALFRLDGRRGATHALAQTAEGGRIVTDGQRTFERVSRSRIILYLVSAIAGAIALLYLLLVGGYRVIRAWRRSALHTEPLRWAVAAMVVLALAPLLYLSQPALAIGDPMIANLSMAVATGVLPVALLLALFHRWRAGVRTAIGVLDFLAVTTALQWCIILAAWGLLPLMLWR